jgi:hypothetical protein
VTERPPFKFKVDEPAPPTLWTQIGAVALLGIGLAIYASLKILRRGHWDLPTFKVVAAYSALFVAIALATFAVARLIRRDGAAPAVSAIVALIAAATFVGARPAGVPTLDEFVDDLCRPRPTVALYALSDPTGFWVEVSLLVERAYEFRDENYCGYATDATERQNCAEYVRLHWMLLEHCRRHAERRIQIHRSR